MQKILRKAEFDILRGIAVALMVFANAAPILSIEPPMIIRYLFSIAAPIFVLMSGFMISQIAHKHSYKYFAVKSIFLLSVAALIDIFINGLVPFEGFDVLYLIGFSIPIAVFASRFSQKTIGIIVLIILFLSHLLRNHFGYDEVKITNIDFSSGVLFPSLINWKSWFISGWFPMLPWAGFMLSGVVMGKIYKSSKDNEILLFADVRYLLLSSILLITGICFLAVEPSNMPIRQGYSEIFYPANTGIFLILLGVASVILFISHFIQDIKFVSYFIRPLGIGALGIYIIHLAIITYVIKPLFHSVSSLDLYFGIYLAHIIFLRILIEYFEYFKSKHDNLPTIIYWLIGK